MSAPHQGTFTPEERRFLFELTLLGLTAGCKLEGFVLAMGLDILDHGEPYARIARAMGLLQLDQLDEADALLAGAEIANSEQADYALSLRAMIARIKGEGNRVKELGRAIEEADASPSLVAMARMLSGA